MMTPVYIMAHEGILRTVMIWFFLPSPLRRLNFAYFLPNSFASDPVCTLLLQEHVCTVAYMSAAILSIAPVATKTTCSNILLHAQLLKWIMSQQIVIDRSCQHPPTETPRAISEKHEQYTCYTNSTIATESFLIHAWCHDHLWFSHAWCGCDYCLWGELRD